MDSYSLNNMSSYMLYDWLGLVQTTFITVSNIEPLLQNWDAYKEDQYINQSLSNFCPNFNDIVNWFSFVSCPVHTYSTIL